MTRQAALDESGRPESFGYVRCTTYDEAEAIAYERPDGAIALFRRVKGGLPLVRKTSRQQGCSRMTSPGAASVSATSGLEKVRVNETRLKRTYSAAEIETALKKVLMLEAGVASYRMDEGSVSVSWEVDLERGFRSAEVEVIVPGDIF